MATTDDRERLEAIANAIMAPHVAQQQHVSERLRSKGSGKRWTRIAAILLLAPMLLNVLFQIVRGESLSPFNWVVLVVAVVAIGIALWSRRQE